MKQVYLSTEDVPFSIAFVPLSVEIKRPFVDEQPSADVKVPKYDWEENRWIDLSKIDDISQEKRIKELEDAVLALSMALMEVSI